MGVFMSSISASLIVFAFVFGGAMLGMYLRSVLPKHHFEQESKDQVKLGMGLVATMAALLLSLLISSAKNSFDAESTELTGASSKLILVDRTLAQYGPEAKPVRELLKGAVASTLDWMSVRNNLDPNKLGATNCKIDCIYDKTQALVPGNDRQRSIQAQALSMLMDLRQTRWLMYEQVSTTISRPLLVILVFWLAALFLSFGLFAPANGTVIASLLVSAVSVSAAILLILELYRPYDGLIRLSVAPLQAALSQLGQ
jgi:hypothetical protein